NPAQTNASEPGKPWYWARRQATAVHRPNRQGTISVATRKTLSVIAAVFGLSRIARDPNRHLPVRRGRRGRRMLDWRQIAWRARGEYSWANARPAWWLRAR